MKENPKEKTNKTGRRVLGIFAALTTGAAVLLNGLFGSPQEMLKNAEEPNRPAIVAVMEEEADEESQEEEEKKNRRPSLGERLRARILALPMAVRVLICIPLWALGWGIVQLWQLLLNAVLSPLMSALASVLLLFGILLAVFLGAAKTIFPNMSFHELLSKSNLIILAAGSLLLEGLLYVLPLVDESAEPFSGLIRFGGGLLILAVLILKLRIQSLSSLSRKNT